MTPKRILLVSINYWPELTGIGKYSGEMAEWLAGQGIEIRVVTAPPYYPAWRISNGYKGWRYYHETIAGVGVIRCPLWVPSQPSGFKRILHLASFAISATPMLLWSALRWRPDVVFVVEPPLFCAPTALLVARLAGARSWLHVQDFEVDAAFELGILRSGWLRRMVLSVERWLMRRFDAVSTISGRMLEKLADKGVVAGRCSLFPNWVELDRIYPLDSVSPLRAEWGIADSDVVILYSGNMGEKQGLEILIEAARQLLGQSALVFLLCGDGAARPRLERLAEGAGNIHFKPLQPIEQLNDLLNMADIHVLPQRGDAADLVLPSKLTNMLASGKPVVATAAEGTQVAELVRNCGIVAPPGDAGALSAALGWLAESADRRKALGAQARRSAEQLWDKEEILSAAFLS